MTHQADAVAAIQARSYFSGMTIISDDGFTTQQQVETALDSTGVAIVVGFPLQFNAREQVGKSIEGMVTGNVGIWVNEKKNAEQASPITLQEAVSELMIALAQSPVSNARRGFEIDSVALEPEEGLFFYLVSVSRAALIS